MHVCCGCRYPLIRMRSLCLVESLFWVTTVQTCKASLASVLTSRWVYNYNIYGHTCMCQYLIIIYLLRRGLGPLYPKTHQFLLIWYTCTIQCNPIQLFSNKVYFYHVYYVHCQGGKKNKRKTIWRRLCANSIYHSWCGPNKQVRYEYFILHDCHGGVNSVLCFNTEVIVCNVAAFHILSLTPLNILQPSTSPPLWPQYI